MEVSLPSLYPREFVCLTEYQANYEYNKCNKNGVIRSECENT